MANQSGGPVSGGHGEHGEHGHGGQHSHAPSSAALEQYQAAYEAIQPQPGGRVHKVELEAGEIEWEFVEGQRTRAWGYNGQIPGPVIEAQVGDVLEVRLKNSLPEPTMIHWHGIRLLPPMDGTENVQRPVATGETFVYRFVLPDAGMFWYHPHINETVQLERGLAGALIVRAPGEPELDQERVLVLDDVEIDAEGQIQPPGGWTERHDGRQGTARLVNGQREPTLSIAAGQVERWRVVNVSSSRYIRLSIGERPFRILGTDGGLIPAPVEADEVLLTPGDRVDLAVGPFAEGESLSVQALRHDRGTFKRQKHEGFATLTVTAAAPSRAHIPEQLRHIQPLVTGFVAPTREVELGFKVRLNRGVDFTINRESHHRDEPVKVGELQVWDVINKTPVDHPFHLHGFFFQVLEVNGEPPPFLSWEDTVNVPARGRARIAWVPDDRPGEWMYHCHILEHHAGGMMAHFEVVR
jgi:FtsP/CotA-like multicopper oxidase with cupredoxin domain